LGAQQRRHAPTSCDAGARAFSGTESKLARGKMNTSGRRGIASHDPQAAAMNSAAGRLRTGGAVDDEIGDQSLVMHNYHKQRYAGPIASGRDSKRVLCDGHKNRLRPNLISPLFVTRKHRA
jgi:hypothetical protein